MGNFFNTILIQPLANGLFLFYHLLWHNLGLAIIAFGVVIRFVLTPLTKPYMNSMKKMKEYEPELAKLKEKYKNDNKALLAAQTEFYKQKKINPGAGCLPYLLQIVILIALFNVFSRVLSSGGVAAKFDGLLYQPLKLAQGEIINTRFLYMDLAKPDSFKVAGIPFGIPGPILFLAAFFQLMSSKMTLSYNPNEKKKKEKKDGQPDMQTSMQQSMVYTFPLFTLIFGLSFPAGLALYWMLFSVFQVVQQYNSAGWGGLTPWLLKLHLLKSQAGKEITDGKK
jgi:YidC/Oxa1 family membrane protein insertase